MKARVGKAVITLCSLVPVMGIVGGAAVASAPEPSAIGTICVPESYQWLGQHDLAPGESFGTGVVVPEVAGTQLEVTAVDHSTGSVVSSALVVSVGTATAAVGGTVGGGEIGAANTGTAALTVTAIALNIDRCHEVESAAPVLAPAVRSSVPSQPPPTVPIRTVPAPTALPSTGSPSVAILVIALATTGTGMLLLLICRRPRRITARGRAT